MTSSIPSGFSREDLEALMAQAPSDIDTTPESDDEEWTQDSLLEAAAKVLDDSLEVCGEPVFHKAIMLIIASRMAEWHTNTSRRQETTEATEAWLRDAGKFQAVMDILTSLTVGPNDPFIS